MLRLEEIFDFSSFVYLMFLYTTFPHFVRFQYKFGIKAQLSEMTWKQVKMSLDFVTLFLLLHRITKELVREKVFKFVHCK